MVEPPKKGPKSMTAKRAWAEEELRNSHANLSALLENTDDYILISDKKGFPVIFNSAYARIMKDALGIEMKPGLQPHKLLPDKKAVAWWDNLHRRVLNGEKFREVYTHDFGKGDIRHLEVSYYPIIRDGEVNGFTEVTRDITECKRAEEELKISEEKWRSLIVNAPDVIMEVSRDGKIRNINRVVPGLSVEQVIGKNVADFMPPDQKGRVMDAIKKVFKTGEPTNYEVVGVGPQGSTAYYSTNIGPIVRGGRVDSTLHVTRDFTERMQAENAVQIVNQCFMNFGSDPIRNLDLITHAVGQVLEAVCVLYNRKEGEMLVTLTGWQIPSDMKKVDRGKGHICFDIIEKGGEKPIVIRDLQHTKYAKTDPNVKKYDLQTYVSCPVRIGKETVASLCAVYQKDIEQSDLQLRILQMLGKAASVEEERRRAEKMLKEQKEALEQKNIALREIVAQIEVEKNKIKDDIMANVDEVLLPVLKKLKLKGASPKYIDLLKHNLESLTSSFGHKISEKRFKLTPREIEICDMIKGGLTSKEISGLLGVSHQTIEKHRKNIREKLRIANKNINLATFLQQL